jgi:thiamine biosynthesis protein ThiI
VRFVVHYAEIGLKGRNRPRFEGALRRNLERTLAPLGSVRVSNLWGRLLVDLPDADPRRARERLRRVFGVAYFSEASVVDPELPAIEKMVDDFVDTQSFASFGIKARRSDKSHAFTSSDLARDLGTRVIERTGARVDLNNPDLWIEIHVLSRRAILLHGRERGPGGMPVGTGGRAISLISGGIDSPVASYEMLKRGLRLAYAHFHSAPFTSTASQAKVRDMVARLARYQGPATLYLVPFASIQQELVKGAPADPRIVLYRRFMLRVAEALAWRERALALVTGESLGQVSSQTLGNLDTINRAATLPVLRPLVGTDKVEIIERARTIETFEISIEPDEDCCSYLMPRNPATWTRPDPIDAIEAQLPVQEMVDDAVARTEKLRIEPDA